MDIKTTALVTAFVAALIGLIVVGTGCNLTLDLQEYPYHASDDAGDEADTRVADARPDATDTADAADASDINDEEPKPGTPLLIFTEVMPDVSTPPDSSVELGEFLEVKNIGTAPADPRHIIIQLGGSNRRIQVDPFPTDPAEREIFESLRPIEPGEHFIFVRDDDDYYDLTGDLRPGSFYEYGRWSDAVPLSNSSRRLQLSYRTGEFELDTHDAVEWASSKLIDSNGDSSANLPVREDAAWGLHPDHENPLDNDDPAHWCYHTNTVGAGVVKASPGAPTPADCTSE